jgi:tetratricopeptide (TPR) repeat protein
MKLRCRTKGDASPRGKRKIYISYCPDDSELLEQTISELLESGDSSDYALYFDEAPGENDDGEQLFSSLREMQLMVLVVTNRFLRSCPHGTGVELPFAMREKIPVLPLLSGEVDVEEFNRICGTLHTVNREKPEYKRKLDVFLSEVLVGNDLAALIRSRAFDAYIFLSYRKKDIAQARRLMQTIHNIDDFRNIAIWYDEYLMPGRDFNESIKKAMQNSRLFALAVTPNLVIEKNYVMNTEYPFARQSGLSIIPIELEKTEKLLLQKLYDGLPRSVDVRDQKALYKAIKKAVGKELHSQKDDTRRLYLIGMAYMSGVDVETDRSRGLRLLEEAANKGNADAMKKLSDMYWLGDGVVRDCNTARNWIDKYACTLQKKGCVLLEDAKALAGAYEREGEIWMEGQALEEAQKCYIRQCEIWDSPLRRETEAMAMHAQALMNLSMIYIASKQYNKACAEMLYTCSLADIVVKASPSAQNRLLLAKCRSLLGGCFEYEDDAPQAHKSYDEAIELLEVLASETGSYEVRFELENCYSGKGDVYIYQENPGEAKACFMKANAMVEQLAREKNTVTLREMAGHEYSRLGNACGMMGDMEAANEWFQKALSVSCELAEETKIIKHRNLCAAAHFNAGLVAEDNKEKAALFGKAGELWQDLYRSTSFMDYKHAYNRAANEVVKCTARDRIKADSSDRTID